MAAVFHVPINCRLPVHGAVFEYCADVDPRVQWAARGISQYDRDADAATLLEAENRKARDLEDAIKNGGKDDRFYSFLTSVMEITGDYMSGADIVTKHFAGKEFVFVLGIDRSGGTYLLQRIMKANGLEMRDFPLGMLHDSIPTFGDFIFNPMLQFSICFEFFQYLAWAKEAFSASPRVFQKRIAYAHWLAQLDAVVGTAATYVVTVRGPLETLASILDSTGGLDGSVLVVPEDRISARIADTWLYSVRRYHDIPDAEWQGLGVGRQYCLYWESYYRNLVAVPNLRGRLVPLAYGDAFAGFMADRYPEVERADPTVLKTRPRDLEAIRDQLGLSDEILSETVDTVARSWDLAGLKFP